MCRNESFRARRKTCDSARFLFAWQCASTTIMTMPVCCTSQGPPRQPPVKQAASTTKEPHTISCCFPDAALRLYAISWHERGGSMASTRYCSYRTNPIGALYSQTLIDPVKNQHASSRHLKVVGHTRAVASLTLIEPVLLDAACSLVSLFIPIPPCLTLRMQSREMILTSCTSTSFLHLNWSRA